jgi:putative hemolysin
MFPAGEVAHMNWKEYAIADPPWKATAARLALRARCPAFPIFFEGANSLGFQLAGLMHPTMRTMGLGREFLRLRGKAVRVCIGSPIPYANLSAFPGHAEATDYMRSRVYFLANRSHALPPRAQHRLAGKSVRIIDPPTPERLLAEEIASLPPRSRIGLQCGVRRLSCLCA